MRQTFEKDLAVNHRRDEYIALRIQEMDLKQEQEKLLQSPKVETPKYKGISEADTDITNRIALVGNAPRFANDEERQVAWDARREALEQEEKEKVKKLKGLWTGIVKDELAEIEQKLSEQVY